MLRKLALLFSALGMAALVTHPLQGQIADPPARQATMTSQEQDAVILARQGLMDGIYQYVEDADDWTEKSAAPNDSAMLQALTREAAHTALMLPAFKQLFPPPTNPESAEFSSMFDTYALPAIWADPARFSADLDATIAAINVLSMARSRSEFTQRLESLQATCDACHDHFRRVYVSPLDPK